MPKRKQPQSNGGFVALVPLLVILTFGFAILVALHQRQTAQGRLLKRVLETRLNQELAVEMQRLQSLPSQQRSGPPEDLAIRALDNLMARALDHMLELEDRRARLRHLARRAGDDDRRRAARRSLRGLDQKINLARFWILLLETRQQDYLRAGGATAPSAGAGGRPAAPGSSAEQVPALPDWW